MNRTAQQICEEAGVDNWGSIVHTFEYLTAVGAVLSLMDGERMMVDHLEGYPVSAATYLGRGCRCDGCRRARRTSDLLKVQHKMDNKLTKWARERITTSERDALRRECYDELGLDYDKRWSRRAG